MMTSRHCFVLLMIFAYPALVTATSDKPDTHDADRQTLRMMFADIENGINKQDMELILRHLDEDVIITYQNAQVAVGKDAVRQFNTQMIVGDNSPVQTLTTKATVGGPAMFHGDTAIGYGTTRDHMVLRTGQTIDLDAAWSSTMVKKNGQWKIAAIHFSTNVLDNDVLHSAKRVMLVAAIITAVITLLIGFWLGRRKKS